MTPSPQASPHHDALPEAAAATAAVRVGVLGPVQLAGEDAGGTLARALIVALAVGGARTGEPRSVAALAEEVWGDDAPQNPRGALQTLVSRVRAAAGADLIRSTPSGYALAAVETDLDRARRLAAEAERLPASDPRRLDLAESALALWRGEPGGDLGEAPIAADLAGEAAALRSTLAGIRAKALMASGRATDAVVALDELAAAHPFDEPLHGELMTALAAAGRASDALAVYAALRERLRDALGSSPAPALAELNTRLLRAQTAPAPARVRVGLRAEPNRLLGRDDDIAAVSDRLAHFRLVTILGAGGLGKTRLANAVATASDIQAVVFVPLAGVRDDEDVPAAIASALGVTDAAPGTRLSDNLSRPDLRTRVIGVLGERPTLLVLDNCEQIVDGVAAWAADMLASVAHLRILATSRTPLAIAAEAVYPLPALASDGEGDDAAAGPAVALFVERARAVRPDAALPPDVVARLCDHLDGLPLAIELAAARVRTMTPAQIEARLKDRFALLTTGDRSAPERHRTLQAVIEWSWDLLDPDARTALATLSLLPGGFSADTAAGVLLEDSADDLLDRLVAQSLLVVVDDPRGEGVRFRMLETVREFGIARLGRDDDADAAWQAVSAWARAFSASHGRSVFTVAGFRDVQSEHENLIAVLRHAIAEQDDPTAVLVFALLCQFWVVGGAFSEFQVFGLDAFDAVLRLRDGEVTADAVALVLFVGSLAGVMMQDPRSLRALARLRILRRRHPELDPLIAAFIDIIPAAPYPERLRAEIDRLRDSGDPARALMGELVLAQWGENEGETAEAMEASVRAWELASGGAAPWFEGVAAVSAAQLSSQRARPAEALEWLERAAEALSPYDMAGDPMRQQSWIRGSSLLGIGRIDEARELFTSLTSTRELTEDGLEMAAIGWLGLAELQRLAGDPAAAVELYERSIATFGTSGQRSSPWYLMVYASFLAAASADAWLPPERLARIAGRLRTRALGAQRLRPGMVDRPVLGSVLAGWSSWALTVDGLRADGLEALALAEALGARQDLPALHLDDHFVRAVSICGSDAVAAARAAAEPLTPEDRVARADAILGRR